MSNYIAKGKEAGGVVVHCFAGVSRSSAACLGYLMLKENFSLNAAFAKVFLCRPTIRPNLGFWMQLRNLELRLIAGGAKLKSHHSRRTSHSPSRKVSSKRSSSIEGRRSASTDARARMSSRISHTNQIAPDPMAVIHNLDENASRPWPTSLGDRDS